MLRRRVITTIADNRFVFSFGHWNRNYSTTDFVNGQVNITVRLFFLLEIQNFSYKPCHCKLAYFLVFTIPRCQLKRLGENSWGIKPLLRDSQKFCVVRLQWSEFLFFLPIFEIFKTSEISRLMISSKKKKNGF